MYWFLTGQVFWLEKIMFWGAKDNVLKGKRSCFEGQKIMFGRAKDHVLQRTSTNLISRVRARVTEVIISLSRTCALKS